MKNNQANKWLDFAWEDLRVIDDLIEEEAYGLACFHAQQAIEKTLKAYLVRKEGKVNKLHSLAELLNLCSNLDNSFKDFENYALTIDRYYIPVRYPDALPGSLPEGMPSKEDAEEALKMAEEIFEFVKNEINRNKIIKQNNGRSASYQENISNPALEFIDIERYFQKEVDQREVRYDRHNFEIYKYLKDLFTKEETQELTSLNEEYQTRIKKLPPAIIKREFERLTIDLSWKSSQIEGNTYSLLDTEALIKDYKEAEGHSKEEALMILNHKAALDYIWQKDNYFQKINLRKIEDIHSLAVKGLGIDRGLRKRMVGIVGTKYRPLDNIHQIKEAMEKTAKIINKTKDPFTKALIAVLMISYIQPFEDGNKRTARLLSNAILLAYDICPLSFRSINPAEFKKALILFYEQNNLRYFKEIFIDQFRFAVQNYFQV